MFPNGSRRKLRIHMLLGLACTTIFDNTAGSSEGEITSTMKRVAVAPGYSYGPADMANRLFASYKYLPIGKQRWGGTFPG